MYKKSIIRVVSCIVLIILVQFITVNVLDRINVASTNYVNAINNEISIDDNFKGLYVINNLDCNNGVLDFNINPEDNEYTLLVSSLTFYHEIYINDVLYSQNIHENEKQYNPNFAYKTFGINKNTNIIITGDGLEKLEFFIADRNIMDRAIEKKITYYAIKMMSLFLLLMLFLIMFFYDKSEKYFLIFILISITSIIKSIALGELTLFVSSTFVNAGNYCIYDNVTTTFNTVLPIFIILNLFEVEATKKIHKFISMVLLLNIIILFVNYSKYFNLVFITFYFIKICITLYGAALKKKYYTVVCFNGIIYFSFAVYKLNVLNGNFPTGILNFYTNTAYIGEIIYLITFAMIFLKKYKNRIDESIKNRKELERITLLRGISHDLKLPLSVIKISSQMIESEKLNSVQIKECANDITQEVDTLEKMTNNINEYLKIGFKDKIQCNTSVKSVFKRIERDFNLINYDNKFNFRVVMDHEDYIVNVDKLELYRVLYNLVDNSFKYCSDGDSILISYKVETKLIIIVEDTGMGIDAEKVNDIFTPFYRADKSHHEEGLGLGLSVVKGIVDKYGGKIYLKSEVNKGTRVTILF